MDQKQKFHIKEPGCRHRQWVVWNKVRIRPTKFRLQCLAHNARHVQSTGILAPRCPSPLPAKRKLSLDALP